MTRPTAREYAQAQDKGAAARRSTRPQTDNPWKSAAAERERILRDARDDAWLQEDNRRRR